MPLNLPGENYLAKDTRRVKAVSGLSACFVEAVTKLS
jgi:hypothetical protein